MNGYISVKLMGRKVAKSIDYNGVGTRSFIPVFELVENKKEERKEKVEDEMKFKTGDKVKFTAEGLKTFPECIGKIYTIEEIQKFDDGYYSISFKELDSCLETEKISEVLYKVNNETSTKGEKEMVKTNGVKVAVQEGLKVGSSKKASKVLTATVKKALGKNYPKFFASGLGAKLEPLVLPVLVSVLAESFGGEKYKKLATYANYAVEGVVADEAEDLLAFLDPLLSSLMSVVPEGSAE